jgi:outer membrane protein TolC
VDEAVSLALRDNRDILLKTEDVKKAKAKIAEARAGLLPTFTFTGGWTKTNELYTKDASQTYTQASLKQPIFKGGKVINTIKYNEYGMQASLAILDKAKLETAYNVQKAFYTLLLAEELSNLNKSILDNTREYLALAQARFAKGEVSQSDLLKIQESLASVSGAQEASLNQVESVQVLLKNLLYLDNEAKIKPDGKFIYEPKEIAYDEGFLKAMKTRPEIKQYAAQEEASKKAIEIAKADARPSISASWDYYSRSHVAGASGLSKNWNDYNVMGLTFSWPIFDGWATRAKVEQAIVDLRQAQLMKEKAARDIASDLKNAYLGLKDAIAKIKTAALEIAVYKDNLEAAKERYQVGIVSFLDLDDANLRYNISMFNEKQAVYDYIIAKENFTKATGGS